MQDLSPAADGAFRSAFPDLRMLRANLVGEPSWLRSTFRTLIWLLFGYEAWVNFVVPPEAGYTTFHLVGYILLLFILAMLVASAVTLVRLGVAAAFPLPIVLALAFLLLWGLYSGLRVVDWGEFRMVAYAWVTPWAGGIWLVPLASLLGAAATVRGDFEKQLRLETFVAIALMSAVYVLDFDTALKANYSDMNLLALAGLVLLFSVRASAGRLAVAVAAFSVFAVGQFLLGLRNGMLRVLFYAFALIVIASFRFFRDKNAPVRFAFLLLLCLVTVAVAGRQVTRDQDVAALSRESIAKVLSGYDSRGGLVADLRANLSVREWILGSDTGRYWSDDLRMMRGNVEGGYLEFLMRGGAIYVLLFAMIVLPAVKRGLQWPVGSPMWLLGLYILERLVWMVTYGNPVVDLGYVTFWIAVGACASHRKRQTDTGSQAFAWGPVFGLQSGGGRLGEVESGTGAAR